MWTHCVDTGSGGRSGRRRGGQWLQQHPCRKVDHLCLGCTTSGARNRALPGPSDVHTFSCHHTQQPGRVTFWHRHSRGQPCDCQLPWAQGGGTISRYASHAQPVPSDLKGPWLQALFHSALHLTQNSELDPSLVAVLPIEGDTGIEATVFPSHMADDQRAIGLQLVSGDQAESGSSIPPDSEGQGRGRVFLFPGERLSGPYC